MLSLNFVLESKSFKDGINFSNSSLHFWRDVLILHKLRKMTAMRFASKKLKSIDQIGFEGTPFDYDDLKEIGAKVKHMSIVNYAQGFNYRLRARDTKDAKLKVHFLNKAIKWFEKALESNPNNKITLVHLKILKFNSF